MWLLSQHPQALETLRNELERANIFTTTTPNDIRSGPITYEELQNCEYLDAVFKETLRLYPPAASARYTADLNETWKGYTLGGAILYVNCYVLHRLPQNWDRPDDFLPERFVGVAPQSYAHKFLPFSKGSRDCLGKYFAILEAKLAIARLAQRYDMTCINPDEPLGYRQTAYPMEGAKLRLSLRT
jgi:cytochrome P450